MQDKIYRYLGVVKNKMWPFSSVCQSEARLTGKTIVITGASGGIGKETARDLYWRGARVILACRNLEKANEAVEDIKRTPPSNPHRAQFRGEPGELAVYELDLTRFSSVRECARALSASEPCIHVLINNAGILMTETRKETVDGCESILQSNYFSHFLLTLLLLPKIRASTPDCRIVNVSSVMHNWVQMNIDDLNMDKSYPFCRAYQLSKLAGILFAKELSRKLEESRIKGITTYSLHPGIVPATEISKQFRVMFIATLRQLWITLTQLFAKTPELGAQTTIHCAVDEAAGSETGLYYAECAVARPSQEVENDEVRARLWSETLKLVGLPVVDDLGELLDLISEQILSA